MSETHLALSLDRFMRRFHLALMARVRGKDVDGVGTSGIMVLLALSDQEPATAQELVTRLSRDKSQLSRTLHHLEDKGLLTRTADIRDARAAVITLTEKGRGLVAFHHRMVAETIDEVCADVTEAERAELKRILDRATRLED